MNPFFSFYGGKFRGARYYPEPKYDVVIEPFAGSAGYSVYWEPKNVILMDKDPNICSVWEYLISVELNDIANLPLLDDNQSVDDFDICDGARALIGFNINKGAIGPCKKPSSWMVRFRGKRAGFWDENRKQRICEQIQKIKEWKMIRGCYETAPDIEATWFIDPPYIDAGKYYKFGSKLIDYGSLARWCLSRRGQVIVCENVGANWLPFKEHRKIKACCSQGKQKYSNEAVFIKEEF